MSEEELPSWVNDTEYDDLAVGEGIADGKTAQQVIEESSNYSELPRGRHDFYVVSAKPLHINEQTKQPCEKRFLCYELDEQANKMLIEREFGAQQVKVIFALVDDPKATISHTFWLPPNDEDEFDLFLHAAIDSEYVAADKRKPHNGYRWNDTKAFLHAEGHGDGPDGKLPSTVSPLRNWKQWPDGSPRTVSLDIEDQKDYGSKELKMAPNGKPYASIIYMSYRQTEATQAILEADAKPAPKLITKPAPKSAIGQSATQAPVRPGSGQGSPPKAAVTPPKSAPAAAAAVAPPRKTRF